MLKKYFNHYGKKTNLYDGVQYKFRKGKYQASVIKHSFSYGGKEGLYEFAVLKNGVMQGDPIGYQTEYEIEKLLDKFEELSEGGK